ncbi:MAG: TatD family hydrolase [Armatimonadetes bacterium]|nr:TatD family hydrolase [Armatimonadota bacterium]
MRAMLVDTHTHLQFPEFEPDRDEVIARALEHGVTRLVVIGTDLPSSRAAIELAERYPGRLFATVGVHPNAAVGFGAAALDELRGLAQREAVVAVGEVGLDFYRDRCPVEQQQAAFAAQQGLALELGLPLVIHSRHSFGAVYEALTAHGGFATTVVMHCFTSEPAAAERFLQAGCYLGMDGPVTYPKAAEAREVAAKVPLDRLLLETDCPYLAPQKFRGRRCEPWQVTQVADEVARVRGKDPSEIAAATSANAARVFGWEQ